MAENAKFVYEFDSHETTLLANNVSPNLICPVEILEVFSPLDFYVSHLCFAETINNMERTMQSFYSDKTKPLSEQVPNLAELKQSACVAKDSNNKFCRGKILENGDKEALLFFVDFGVTKYIKWNDIKPLWSNFAELPPLALKCRLQEIDSKKLEYCRIDKFRKLITYYQSIKTQFYAEFDPSPSRDVYDTILYLRMKESDNYYSLHEKFSEFLNFKYQSVVNGVVDNRRSDEAKIAEKNWTDGVL